MNVDLPSRPDLVLGIDGGGTHTIAVLADATRELGRGTSGPSNIQAIGVDAGMKSLSDCIERAFLSAELPRLQVGAICLGLAGVDREEGIDIINNWVKQNRIAAKVSIANDATLLLAAGTPDGWGLAIVAGTGSIAFVRSSDGTVGRCGGWGWLLGDEGSAYNIARRALRAACRAHDGTGPATKLVEAFVQRMGLKDAPEFIPAVYRGAWDKAAIAGLAPLVMELATQGDGVAVKLVQDEARDLARTASTAVKASTLPRDQLPIALTGGVITENLEFRELFLDGLRSAGIQPGIVQLVTDPVQGAVVLARKML